MLQTFKYKRHCNSNNNMLTNIMIYILQTLQNNNPKIKSELNAKYDAPHIILIYFASSSVFKSSLYSSIFASLNRNKSQNS